MLLTLADFLSLHSQHVIPDVLEDIESDPEKKQSTAQQLLGIWK